MMMDYCCEVYLDSLMTYLDSIEDLLVRIDDKMDKMIKKEKKKIDKGMNALLKADIKRDKKCEHDTKMAHKKYDSKMTQKKK